MKLGFAFNPSPFPSKYTYIYTPQMDLHIIFIYKLHTKYFIILQIIYHFRNSTSF